MFSAPRSAGRAEKVRVAIGGVPQGMFISGSSPGRPVLLFVHGGPGMPEFWLTRRYPTGMEDLFTVVWWEQRGAGLSYSSAVRRESMTVERFIADTLEVTQYLRRRFSVDRVHLMGHSWGSFIGLQAAAASPELFRTYTGMGQITHQLRSEQESYRYLLAAYQARGDQRMVRRLEAAPVGEGVPLPAAYEALRDKAMHGLGVGTPREKVNLWRGKVFSRRSGLWDAMLSTDLTRLVPGLPLPAYYLHGKYDHTVSYDLARAYAGDFRGPRVGFYTFPQSAHSPALEEPERTLRILREDVLTGRTALADAL
ncbi:MAG: alpha/beta hydrolase [Micrococcales bacterium]|nr:alpha/beta hydrolase [Micrococcales bacterium]